MSIKRKHGYARLWRTLPELFDLQPTSDYRAFFAQSARELNEKAWGLTAAQMAKALEDVNRANPDLRCMVQAYLAKSGQENILEQQSREFDELLHRIERQQRELDWHEAELNSRGSRGAVKRRALSPA